MLQNVLIYIHVMAAIVAFGPTFTFPLIGGQIAKNPQHARFGTEVMEVIETRLVVPVAVLILLTGLLMWWNGGFPLTTRWLDSGLVLYIVAMGLATGYMVPNTRKILELMAAPAGPGGGPSPELASRIQRSRLGGIALAVLLFVIAALMIFKPGV